MFSKLTKKSKAEHGFTIIEMAIVITIIGIFLASAGQLYIQYDKYQKRTDTQLDIEQATSAIADFRGLYGRYPCPAPLTDNREDSATYGIETDCADTSAPNFELSAGVTPAGVAVVPGARTPGERVRVGMIPFRTLNIQEDQAYDGERNRFFYAITESLAVANTFAANGGEIAVINDLDETLVDPANSAHFIVMSAGENGAGAYNSRGTLNPCAAGSLESENCDITVDATFRRAEQGNVGSGNAGQFDDEIIFATHKDIPLWETDNAASLDISMKPTGNVGVGQTASNTPTEELQVDGIIRAQDDPSTPIAEGKVQTNNLCDYASNTNDCFAPKLIGGEIATGGGMQCPPGEYMTGIRDGAPVCKDEVIIECENANERVEGISDKGELKCEKVKPGCETAQVQICDETQTLFASPHGTEITLTAGYRREEEYECNSGTWQLKDSRGECVCPALDQTKTLSCANWSGSCGYRYSGTWVRNRVRECPSGNIIDTEISNSCQCETTTQTQYWGCGNGFNKGNNWATRTHICTSATDGYCSPRVDGNDCRCEPERQTALWWCPNGLEGRYEVYRDFTCPNGSEQPGSWGGWVVPQENIDANCTCTPGDEVTYEDCDDGLVGQKKITRTKVCPSGDVTITEDTSACQPPPPVTCKWQMVSNSGQTSTSGSGNRVGEVCTCGEPNASCKSFLSGSQFAVGTCSCK